MKRKEEVLNIKMNYYQDSGIWTFTVLFVLGYSYDELNKVLTKTGAEPWRVAISEDRELYENSDYLAMKRTVEKDGEKVTYFIIKIKSQFRFTDHEMCALAHEVLHICQYALPDLLRMDEEQEAVAYTHTYLMENILKELRLAYTPIKKKR